MSDESAVQAVARLHVGECYVRATFISWDEVTPGAVDAAKRRIKQTLSKVKDRAQKQTDHFYRYYGIHTLTSDLDIVVLGIIVRDSDL